MASETKDKDSALDDVSSDSGSTESSPLASDVELSPSGTEPSLEHRFFRQRREIAWRWTWLKLQCADLRRQDKKCEETLARLRQQKGPLTLLQPEVEGETHALRTTGITPPKQNRKIIKRPPDVGQIRNPFQEAAAHTLFSLKPPVMKKMPEKKNPLASSSQSVTAAPASQSPVVDVMDQSSEAQASLSASAEQPAASVAAAAPPAAVAAPVPEEEEEGDFYGDFYPSDESDEGPRVRSHKRSSRGADDDGATPRRKMSRSVDFELPDTRSLTSSGRSRRNLRASDWDMNNIVVPLSITSPRALTVVKPKEIVTPGWKQQKESHKAEHKEPTGEVRLIDEDAPAPVRVDGAAASSSENTADELYAARHTPHEKAERARWEAPLQKKADGAHAGSTPNDFIVTGEFDKLQSGGTGGKGAPRRLDFGTPRSHKKSGGGGGGTLRRSRPSRAGLYWMRSRFYADLKWELVRREDQPETVFIFRHLNGPIPHPSERGGTAGVGVLKRTNSETIIEDDEVEVTIRHRNPSASSVPPVVPTAPEPVDPALAEAPYSPSVADTLGGDNLKHSANLSLSLASSVPDSLMGEPELDDLEMHEAQLEQSGEVEADEERGLSESRNFEEEEGDEGEEEGEDAPAGDAEAEEEGASPRERAWAVRSMLVASEESDITIKIRGASSTPTNANNATAAVAATSPDAAESLVKEARTAEPGNVIGKNEVEASLRGTAPLELAWDHPFCALVLFVALCSVALLPYAGAATLPAAQQQEFVDRHNYWRGLVTPSATNMEALYWSPTLATAAQAWSDLCVFKHSNSGYGENMYYQAGSAPYTSTDGIPIIAVDLWQSEVANYNFTGIACANGSTCGHYTQLVWAMTTSVGCGATICNPLNDAAGSPVAQFTVLIVCNYYPAGNVMDYNLNPPRVGRPYVPGPSPPAWASSTATSRTAATLSASGSLAATQSTSIAVVSTTANAAGPTVASTASTSISSTTTSYAVLTSSAATTSTASAVRSTTVGVVSTTFGQSITGGSGTTSQASTTTRASATTTAAATTGPVAPSYLWIAKVHTAQCLALSTTLPSWANDASIATARLQVMSYVGCSPGRQSGPYLLQLLVLDDPTGASARAVAAAATRLGGASVLTADVEVVWLATQPAEEQPAAPKAGVQSLTLVVMVVSLAIAAGVILLLAGIIACLALRKPPSVIVRSEPLLPASSAWGQQMSVLTPRLSAQYNLSRPAQGPRSGPYTALDDDSVLAALYAAAGASNPLAGQ